MLSKAPTIYQLKALVGVVVNKTEGSQIYDEATKTWVPARPLGFYSIYNRIEAAWLVFTGKADAFIWPGDQ